MKTLRTALVVSPLIASLIFALGCEEKKESPAPAPAPTAQPVTNPAESKTAAPAETNKTPEEPAKPSAATAQGAVDLFLAAMRAGDLDSAVSTLDPASEGFDELNKLVTVLRDNPKLPPDAVEMVKTTLKMGYKDMTSEPVIESGDRARVILKPKDREPITVEMNKVDNAWKLIAPKTIMQFNVAGAPKPAETPAAPAPAPTPAPAGGAPESK